MVDEKSDIKINSKTGRFPLPFPSPVGRRARDEGNSSFPEVQQPDFFAHVNPDTFLAGFNLTAEEVRSQGDPVDPDNDAGWFFILEERAGDLRFGVDVPEDSSDWSTIVYDDWSDLTWAHIAEAEGLNKINDLKHIDITNTLTSDDQNDPSWAKNAANMAYIFFQSHVRVAIHADKMIKND